MKLPMAELRRCFGILRKALSNSSGLSIDEVRVRDRYYQALKVQRRARSLRDLHSERRTIERYLRVYAYFQKRHSRRLQLRLRLAAPIGINGRVRTSYFRSPVRWLE